MAVVNFYMICVVEFGRFVLEWCWWTRFGGFSSRYYFDPWYMVCIPFIVINSYTN